MKAIADLEEELSAELQTLEEEFLRTTNQHVLVQQDLDVQIGQTQINVNNGRDFIDNILVPSIEQTNNKITRVNQFMDDNRDALKRDTLNRQKDHQEFLDRGSRPESY